MTNGTIADKFEFLAEPVDEPALQGASRAVVFFQTDLEDELGGDLRRLPRPDYEHSVWRETATDVYWIVRPDEHGGWGWRPKELAKMERIR